MTASTEKKYTNFAQTRLEEAISNTDLTCKIVDEPTQLFTGWAPGSEFYLTLVDASANREIVKVTGISGKWLTISRGQQSTTARSWPIGTLIEQRPTADDMSDIIQREGFRTVAYNPNGVLTAEYPGEKVRQTGYSCEERWWKHVASTYWQLIAGEACSWEKWEDNEYGTFLVVYLELVAILDDCGDTSDISTWRELQDALDPVDETTLVQEGSHAMKLRIDADLTVADDARWIQDNQADPLDWSAYSLNWFGFWIYFSTLDYVAEGTGGSNTQALEFWIGDMWLQYRHWFFDKSELQVGWNFIVCDPLNPDPPSEPIGTFHWDSIREIMFQILQPAGNTHDFYVVVDALQTLEEV